MSVELRCLVSVFEMRVIHVTVGDHTFGMLVV